MKKLLIIFAFFGCALFSSQLNAQDYKVIVNKSNHVSSMTNRQISRIFLKKDVKWKNGINIIAIDQPHESAARVSFSEAIHGKGISAIKGYWQRMIFSGRSIPPTIKASDEEVLDFVKKNPDAIGYVSASAKLNEVKVLKITGEK